MSVTFPEAVKAQGNVSVTVVPKGALTAPPTSLATINTTGVNVSMYFFSGAGMPSKTTAVGEAPRRLGSKEVAQEFGTTSRAIADLSYVYDPQKPLTDPVNAAREVLTEGEGVWIYYRFGVDAETPLAATDIVDIWDAELGPQNKSMTGDGDFDQLNIVQSVISNTPPVEDVALTA